VLHRRLLPDNLEGLARFGFEVYLNAACIKARARIAVVRWPNVASPAKEAKFGFWAGLRADARMMADIFRTVPPVRLIGQILAMRRLRVTSHVTGEITSANVSR